MMTLAIVFSFLDRGLLSLLVEPVKADLGISDTQMSLLLGFAFASFYAVMGIPFGILVDRVHRVGLMSVGFLLWTIATAASGLTRSFGALFAMRMAVGVGEATAGPAAPSVIADSVPKERLATAMSIYAMGVYLGAGLATVIGGAVAGIAVGQGDVVLPLVGLVKPWQLAFILVGLAGLIPLVLIVTTVREPERKGAMADRAPRFADVAAHYRRHRRAIGLHHLAFTALTFSSYGIGSWLPSFFVRTFGWPIGQTGLWLGINAAVTASVSVMIGGSLADRWYRQGKKDAKMRVPLLGSLLWLVPGFSFLLAPTGTISMVLLTIATLIGHLGIGCIVASLQELMPNRMRGQAVAIYAVVTNLIGLGLGPTAVALLTDFVFGDESKLRYSLLVVAVVCHVVMSTALWLSLKPYRESVTELERAAAGAAAQATA
jgi:MFS family permease